MKHGFIFFTLVLASLNSFAFDSIPSPVENLFVPNGFDNNDNVEVVITGKFPGPCFSRNLVSVEVKENTINIYMTTQPIAKSQNLCGPLKVPFSEVVSIGNLQGGEYQIIVNNKIQDSLFVETSQSQSVDEHLYAPVEFVDLGFTGGLSGHATIIAKSISQCLQLDHVEYLSNGKNTFSILPIMKKVSPDCPEENERLEIPIKYDLSKIREKKVLLFVRSIDGKSSHTLINVD